MHITFEISVECQFYMLTDCDIGNLLVAVARSKLRRRRRCRRKRRRRRGVTVHMHLKQGLFQKFLILWFTCALEVKFCIVFFNLLIQICVNSLYCNMMHLQLSVALCCISIVIVVIFITVIITCYYYYDLLTHTETYTYTHMHIHCFCVLQGLCFISDVESLIITHVNMNFF